MTTTTPGVLTDTARKAAGVLAAPPPDPSPTSAPRRSGIECIAPLMVDGGTRFALEVDPEVFEEISSIQGHAARPFRKLLRGLRSPTTRLQQRQWRDQGGRTCLLPHHQLGLPGFGALEEGTGTLAEVTVRGDRREQLTFHVLNVVHIRLNVETGVVRLQLKAGASWALGYAAVAEHWLSLALWWCTGEHCTLADSHRKGWRVTGLELCSDFVGLEFTESDADAFVGFRSAELVRKFSKDGKLQTLNLGTRASPVSLCLYDKDEQLAEVKQGDDSTYRAVHVKHGWDGKAERRRVEFRLTGRGLQYADDEGNKLDFRDPAVLADREALGKLWALLCEKKRLIEKGSATRRERAKNDARWDAIAAASGVTLETSYRQTREVQKDAHEEAVKRARRDLLRRVSAIRALNDIPEGTPASEVVRFVVETTNREDLGALKVYERNYRKLREPFMGEEIQTYGRADWERWERTKDRDEAA